jgi:hypothetical protein
MQSNVKVETVSIKSLAILEALSIMTNSRWNAIVSIRHVLTCVCCDFNSDSRKNSFTDEILIHSDQYEMITYDSIVTNERTYSTCVVNWSTNNRHVVCFMSNNRVVVRRCSLLCVTSCSNEEKYGITMIWFISCQSVKREIDIRTMNLLN